MNVGIIICTDYRDTCFLAIRYATFHLMEQKDVKIYFVDAGLEYNKIHDRKYNLNKLLDEFVQSGGKFYKCRNHDILKNHLVRHFGSFVHLRQIESTCNDDRFKSIMTKDIYIRKFTK